MQQDLTLTDFQLRNTLIAQFYHQCPHPLYDDVQQFGRSLEWRTELLSHLAVIRSVHDPFPAIIQRQIEDDLDRYQREITGLSDELQVGDIDTEEFDNRLRNLTIAILLLAFLRGSQVRDEEMTDRALATLRSGGEIGLTVDWANIPTEAVSELREEIRVSIEAAENLGTAILAGRYEDRRSSLASRLALWATTALGVYSLGVLFQAEDEEHLQWLWGATLEHCTDCQFLNGQVHTRKEWREFFRRTGKRPQSRSLVCKGYHCLCGTYRTDEPLTEEALP